MIRQRSFVLLVLVLITGCVSPNPLPPAATTTKKAKVITPRDAHIAPHHLCGTVETWTSEFLGSTDRNERLNCLAGVLCSPVLSESYDGSAAQHDSLARMILSAFASDEKCSRDLAARVFLVFDFLANCSDKSLLAEVRQHVGTHLGRDPETVRGSIASYNGGFYPSYCSGADAEVAAIRSTGVITCNGDCLTIPFGKSFVGPSSTRSRSAPACSAEIVALVEQHATSWLASDSPLPGHSDDGGYRALFAALNAAGFWSPQRSSYSELLFGRTADHCWLEPEYVCALIFLAFDEKTEDGVEFRFDRNGRNASLQVKEVVFRNPRLPYNPTRLCTPHLPQF